MKGNIFVLLIQFNIKYKQYVFSFVCLFVSFIIFKCKHISLNWKFLDKFIYNINYIYIKQNKLLFILISIYPSFIHIYNGVKKIKIFILNE